MPLCNVWSGPAANTKRAGFHWTTPVSLMASLWSQREPADRQRRHGATLPRVWPNPALCLVCFGARRICKHTNKCVSTHPCSYCPSCFTPAASLPEPNTRRFIPRGLFQRVRSLLPRASARSWPSFRRSLQKSPESHRGLAHITAAPSCPTRHDRHINAPSHLIEHSVHKEEGNAVNVEECRRCKKKEEEKVEC